jgi:hypothetical protein
MRIEQEERDGEESKSGQACRNRPQACGGETEIEGGGETEIENGGAQASPEGRQEDGLVAAFPGPPRERP